MQRTLKHASETQETINALSLRNGNQCYLELAVELLTYLLTYSITIIDNPLFVCYIEGELRLYSQ